MSNFARRSEVHAVAEVSPLIPVNDTSRQIKNLAVVFDRLYQNFTGRVLREYEHTRTKYMEDFRLNYDANVQKKNEKIAEVNREIQN